MRGPKVKSEKAQRFISRGTGKAISKAHFPGLDPESEDAFLAEKSKNSSAAIPCAFYCPTLGRNKAPKGAGSFPLARRAYEKSGFVLYICCPSLILGLGARQLSRSGVSGDSTSGPNSSEQPGRCPAADESECGPGHACLPGQCIRSHYQGSELSPSRWFHHGRFSRHRSDAQRRRPRQSGRQSGTTCHQRRTHPSSAGQQSWGSVPDLRSMGDHS